MKTKHDDTQPNASIQGHKSDVSGEWRKGSRQKGEAHGEERREGAERESRRSVKPSDDS